MKSVKAVWAPGNRKNNHQVFFSGRIKLYLEGEALKTKNKLNRVRTVKTKMRKVSEEAESRKHRLKQSAPM